VKPLPASSSRAHPRCRCSLRRVRRARKRLRAFFRSHIRNRKTRRSYLESVRQFAAFCAEFEVIELSQVEAVHVAAFVGRQLQTNSRPTVKLRLAALRMLFDWLVFGQVMASNPAPALFDTNPDF
jgi:site-specific recombinase XerC